MDLQTIEKRIIDYLEGDLSLKEQYELVDWVKENEGNARYYVEIKDVWESSYLDANEVADTRQEWLKFKSHIQNVSVNSALKLKKVLRIWQAVAAVVVVLLAGVSFLMLYQQNAGTEVLLVKTVVPSGEKSRLELPDGTIVWINSASVLTYNTDYGRVNRNISLEGEAYFEVASNADLPFLVHTKDCEVKVLGTKFNVMAYASSPHTETSLLEGRVDVSLLNGKKVGILPGQVALANGYRNSLQIIEGNINNIICWKDNVLKFDNTPLTEVIEKLDKWYGVAIELNNSELLAQKRFTFTVKSESLSELLNIMKLVQPLEYHIDGERVSITILNL
ncbi:FecR family protein [Carboxylicivirga sp. A043]|uniref:FecR family protein n=1 Tax=Carboxylicivirga litoralis TaxID=2816963 RepID=UPI0021CB6A2F|nr:FecR family protein [Carboxylicivirga sp. A043]MCU4154587.1 FecR family protein [Carboxylicivirga sp. A043]